MNFKDDQRSLTSLQLPFDLKLSLTVLFTLLLAGFIALLYFSIPEPLKIVGSCIFSLPFGLWFVWMIIWMWVDY